MGEFWHRAMRDELRGEISDGDIRYVMLRADVVCTLVDNLPLVMKRTVLDAFRDAVKQNGGRSLDRYLALGGGDIDTLLGAVRATAADLGWGAWTLDRDAASLVLEVRSSPFAAITAFDGEPVCAPVLGMFQALSDRALNRETVGRETQCRALGAPHCRFVAGIVGA